MSLINQVLKDLDERRSIEHAANCENKSNLEDLHFSYLPSRQRKIKLVVIASAVGVSVIAIVLGGFFVYQQSNSEVAKLNNSIEPSAQIAATPVTSVLVKKSKSEKSISTVSAPDKISKEKISKPKSGHDLKPVKRIETVAVAETVSVVEEETEDQVNNAPVEFSRSSVPMRSEQKAERSYQNGYEQLKAQRHQQAERSLRQALSAEAGHIKARELLSGIYIKQGRWIEASELLREGLAYSPEHLVFSKLYARSLMQLNRDEQAINVLKRYAPTMKSDPDYYAILAALYQRQNRHHDAAEVYARLVSIKPGNGVWWVGLGISLETVGRKQDALQAYSHARSTGNLAKEVARFTNNRLLALEALNFPLE